MKIRLSLTKIQQHFLRGQMADVSMMQSEGGATGAVRCAAAAISAIPSTFPALQGVYLLTGVVVPSEYLLTGVVVPSEYLLTGVVEPSEYLLTGVVVPSEYLLTGVVVPS